MEKQLLHMLAALTYISDKALCGHNLLFRCVACRYILVHLHATAWGIMNLHSTFM